MPLPPRFFPIVQQICGKVWQNRGFNDKSIKTSKNVALVLLNKIGYGQFLPKYTKMMIFRAFVSHLEKVHHCLRSEIYTRTPKVTPRSEISGKRIQFLSIQKKLLFLGAILELVAILKS